MPELTDISVIRALCEKYDFALSKGCLLYTSDAADDCLHV